MKNLSLFTFIISISSMPLIVGQDNRFNKYKEQMLKNKIYSHLSSILRINQKLRILSDRAKMHLLDLCSDSDVGEGGVEGCQQVKDQILMMNDWYVPSKDEKLKKTLENPDDLDILDFNSLFDQKESVVAQNMTDVIDKNMQRIVVKRALESAEKNILRGKVIQELSYRYFVNSWWSWLNHDPSDSNSFKIELYCCLYVSNLDAERLNLCSKYKNFIQSYVPKFAFDDMKDTAQDLVRLIDANSKYNQVRIKYQESLSDLYTQE